MDTFRQEIRAMFITLAVELRQQVISRADTDPVDSEDNPFQSHRPLPSNPEQAAGEWATFGEELPTRPPPPEDGLAKLFKLAKKLKRRAAMMTAGRDLHDIHTVLHMVSAWEQLPESAKMYASHRIRLLYIAITKGWPAALFYDQQGEYEFLDLAPDFWLQFQPRAFTASQPQQRASKAAPRKARGKQQQGSN
jgi:hypothetical protein